MCQHEPLLSYRSLGWYVIIVKIWLKLKGLDSLICVKFRSVSQYTLFLSPDALKENKQPQRNVDGLKCNTGKRKRHLEWQWKIERGLKVINSVCKHPQNSAWEVAFQSLRKLINAFSLMAGNLDNLCSLFTFKSSLYQKRIVMKTERARVCSAYGTPLNKAGGNKEAYVHDSLQTLKKKQIN